MGRRQSAESALGSVPVINNPVGGAHFVDIQIAAIGSSVLRATKRMERDGATAGALEPDAYLAQADRRYCVRAVFDSSPSRSPRFPATFPKSALRSGS